MGRPVGNAPEISGTPVTSWQARLADRSAKSRKNTGREMVRGMAILLERVRAGTACSP
jgi:hypothetical protein